jgi:replication factor C subunit 3/5
MFLIDKYNINNLSDIIFHKEIYNKLIIGHNIENLLYDIDKLDRIIKSKKKIELATFYNTKNTIYKNYEQMPNLLIHGSDGCGKHTLIKFLLRDIFDNDITDTFYETYIIDGYGNKSVNIDIEQSKYHLIIEPKNSGLDKYIIQNIVKEYAKKNILNISSKKYPYRIIFINNVDNLNYYAQASLRRTMEIYHKTCRFILCSKNMSKIIDPISSRCLNIRIPKPNKYELLQYIYYILLNENLLNHKYITNNKINKLINNSNGNVKKMLWEFQMLIYGINNYELSWKKSLNPLLEIMIAFKEKKIKILNIKLIPYIRDILYNIFTTNIPSINILHEIINIIINSNQFDDKLLYKILMLTTDFEVRLNKSKRSIIHLDAYMCNIFNIIYNHYNLFT